MHKLAIDILSGDKAGRGLKIRQIRELRKNNPEQKYEIEILEGQIEQLDASIACLTTANKEASDGR